MPTDTLNVQSDQEKDRQNILKNSQIGWQTNSQKDKPNKRTNSETYTQILYTKQAIGTKADRQLADEQDSKTN